MKTMRKLFRVLLALAMTLALAVPAFAAETTGSITITNPQGGHTYTAYKIFDVTYSGVNHSYTISDTDAAYSTVKAYADEPANGLNLTPVADTNKYNVSSSAGFSAASFAQYLKTKADSLGTGTAFIEDGNTMKASGLALGYYFISGTSGTVCELATAKDIQIRDKNEVPEIKKDVDDNDRTVEIGQKLTYTITGKVPSTKGYDEFTYQVTDTMTEGLTFNKDVTVTIGGVDVARITDRERRTCIGCVEQHFSRVPGTVLEQITLGDPQITAEMARNAAKLAGIDEAIQALPEGCDTVCSDGMFSQGEWQLLSIARAAAADPAVLLLDEVTANLDAETEARVLEALRRASAGRTVLSVSHRIYENLGGRTVKIEPQSM